MNRAIRSAGEARVVCNHANGGPVLVELAEKIHHCIAILGIEIPRRLVRKENQRRAAKPARDRIALHRQERSRQEPLVNRIHSKAKGFQGGGTQQATISRFTDDQGHIGFGSVQTEDCARSFPLHSASLGQEKRPSSETRQSQPFNYLAWDPR